MARGKPGWDWVPCESFYTPSQGFPAVGAVDTLVLVTPQGGSGLAVSPAVAVPDDTEELTVHRVVGQIDLISTHASGIVYACLRIGVALIDPQSGIAIYPNTLFSGVDANEPMLWQRYFALEPGDHSLSMINSPAWGAVDIRAKRRLSIDEALVLEFGCTQAAAGDEPSMRVMLRSLVKKK